MHPPMVRRLQSVCAHLLAGHSAERSWHRPQATTQSEPVSETATTIEYRVIADLSEVDLTKIDRSESRTGHYEYDGDMGDGKIRLVKQDDQMEGWNDERRSLHMNNFKGCLDRGGMIFGAFSGDRLVGMTVLDGEWMGRRKDMLDMYFLFASRDVRGAGIGGALIQRAANAAAERGRREQQIGVQGAQLNPLGLFLESPGPLPTHPHTIYMAYY